MIGPFYPLQHQPSTSRTCTPFTVFTRPSSCPGSFPNKSWARVTEGGSTFQETYQVWTIWKWWEHFWISMRFLVGLKMMGYDKTTRLGIQRRLKGEIVQKWCQKDCGHFEPWSFTLRCPQTWRAAGKSSN